MSTTIDNKVVKMTFDNKDFETNAKASLGTITKLQDSLKLTGATKGMEEIDAAAKKMDFTPAANSVGQLQKSFSALEVVSITAIAKITSAAIDMGTSITNALAIQPVFTGFSEYETQIGAIQTILANTSKEGTSLTQVNRALDELNTYADRTIYNFTEMTRNIGTFTAAGVDLNTSVDAIKGIANLAAVSGSTSAQASTAMYQLSQALAAGRVSLMDWNSVVNAGMGGQVFQDALKETSRLLGTGVDEALETYGSFRESLTSGGWLTTEVLTETLSKFTGDLSAAQLAQKGYTEAQIEEILALGEMANDAATKVKTFTQLVDTLKEAAQSGWSQTWRIIVGDFEEAKDLFTEISDVIGGMIGASADARNKVLEAGLSSGWKQFLGQGVIDEDLLMNNIADVAQESIEGYDEMIAEFGSFQKALSSGFLTSDLLAQGISKTQEYLNQYSSEYLVDELGYTNEQIEAWNKLGESIADGTVSLEDWSKEFLKISGRENIINGLKNVFTAMVKVLEPIDKAFKSIFAPITGEQIYSFTEGFEAFTAKLIITDETAAEIQKTFEGIFSVLKIVTDTLGTLVGVGFEGLTTVVEILSPLVYTLGGAFGGLVNSTASWINQNISLSGILKGFNTIVEKTLVPISKWISENVSLTTSLQFLKDRGTEVATFFSFFAENLATSFDALMASGITIDSIKLTFEGLVTAIVDLYKNLSSFGSANFSLETVKQGVADAISQIKLFFTNFFKSIEGGFENFIITIANAFGWLFETVQNVIFKIYGETGDFLSLLSSISTLFFLEKIVDLLTIVATPIKAIAKVLEEFGGILGSVKDVIESFQKTVQVFNGVLKAFKFKLYAEAIKTFALSIAILAASVLLISLIDPARLWSSIAAIGFLATILGVLAKSVSNVEDLSKLGGLALVIISFGVAMLIVASAINKLEDVKFGTLLTFAFVMATFVGILVFALNKMDKGFDKNLVKLGITLLLIGVAIKFIIESISSIVGMQLTDVLYGLTVMIAAIAGMGALAKTFSGDINKAGFSILAIAVSMIIFAKAIEYMAGIDQSTLSKAIPALITAVLSMIALAIAIRIAGKRFALAGASIIAIAASFILLGIAMRIIGAIKPEQLASAIVTLTAIGLVITLIILALTSFSKIPKKDLAGIGLTMIGIAVAFSAIAFAMWMLGMLDAAVLARSAAAVIGIGMMFSLLLKSLGNYKNVYRTVLGLAVIIVVLVASMYALTLLSYDQVVESVKKMIWILGLLSLVLIAAKATSDSGKSILYLAITIGVLTASLMLLTLFDPDKVMKNAFGMGAVLVGLGASIKAFDSLKIDFKSVISSMVVMAAIMLGIAELFKYMQDLDGEAILPIAISLSIVLLAMSAAMFILSKIGPAAAVSLPSLLSLVAVVIGIGAVFAALGYIYTEFSWAKQAIDGSIELLTVLAEGLATIITIFGVTVTASLITIGENLSTFATNLQPFIDIMTSIDPNIITSAGALAGAITALSASGLANAFASFIIPGEGMEGFETNLIHLAEGLKTFEEETAGIENVDKIALLAEGIALIVEAASGIDSTGGFFGELFGEKDFEKFTSGIEALGELITDLSGDLYTTDSEKIQNLFDGINLITEAADGISKTGGIQEGIFGSLDGNAFKTDILSLASLLHAISSETYNIDLVRIQLLVDGIMLLIDSVSNMSKTGGLVGGIFGEMDIDKFAADMATMQTLLASLSGITTKSDMKTGAEDSGVNLEKIEQFGEGVRLLSDTANYISQSEGSLAEMMASIFAANDAGVLASQMIELSQALTNVSTAEIDPQAISKIGEFVTETLGANIGTEEDVAFIVERCNILVTAILDTVTPTEGSVFDISLYNAGFGVISSMVRGVEGNITAIAESGKMSVQGFADGINLNVHIAREAASRMAQAAIDAANATLDVNSPSRVFFTSGNFGGLGFVGGLLNQVNASGQAGAELASSAITSLQNTLNGMTDVVDSEINTNLVIRPVVDTSGVTSGIKTINNELSTVKASSVGVSISASEKAKREDNDSRTASTVSNVTNYNQTITSPKAVSKTEIYRHSNNLLARTKGGVKT